MKAMRDIIVKSALAGLALSGAGMAQANPIQFDPAPGYYIFQSEEEVDLTKSVLGFPVTARCIFTVGGNVFVDANDDVVIEVVAAHTARGPSNDSKCDLVSFPGTYPTSGTPTSPWIATVPHASIITTSATDNTAIAGTFTGVNVSTSFLGSCVGNVAATFQNTTTAGVDEPSLFDFSGVTFGGCTVDGTVYSIEEYDFDEDGVISGPYETADAADIDVWH